MTALATLLRALQLFAHNRHHDAKGDTFFGDHEFYGNAYAAFESAYDSVVEAMCAVAPETLPNLLQIQRDAVTVLGEMNADTPWDTLLTGEHNLQAELHRVISDGKQTDATINLLAGIAEASQKRQYFIQRRTAK